MKVEFVKKHTLKENRTAYQVGDTVKVSRAIRDRLVEDGVAKDFKPSSTPPKSPVDK